MSRDEFVAEIDALLGAEHDYNSSAEAMATAAVSAFNLVADRLGVTGFQASWAALKAYQQIMDIKGPFRIFRAEDLLYPQYDGTVERWQQSDDVQQWLSEKAVSLLAESPYAVDKVRARWRELAAQVKETAS